MGHVLADTVIAHHRRRLRDRARRLTIDLDPTDDPTHGQQEFTFFNGHYDTWCYLPLVAWVTFDDEAEQYAVGALLRPGNAPASRGALGLLRRLIRKLRAAFPGATLRVRLDGGFATPKVFAFLEAQGVEYVVAMASNVRLEKRARRLLGKARMLSKATGQTAQLYGDTRYAARSWTRKRRVVMKAEVVRHQGAASRAGAGSDQLLAVPGQPVPGPADPDRVPPVPRAAAARPEYRLGGRPGEHAPRARDQARRVGPALGAPRRPALPPQLPLAPALAAARPGRGRHLTQRAVTALRPDPGRRVSSVPGGARPPSAPWCREASCSRHGCTAGLSTPENTRSGGMCGRAEPRT